MTVEEITSIQNEANRLVFEGRKVHVEVDILEELQPASKDNLAATTGRSVGKGLPEDYTGGVKRVIVIDGVDRNPYVPSLVAHLEVPLRPY
jgi:misacylated tRNA(Ala) deacylase